jgi:hypothetical protein
VIIEIGIAIEIDIDIGSIGENLDNDPDPDPDFDGLDRAALQKLDASAKMSAPQGSLVQQREKSRDRLRSRNFCSDALERTRAFSLRAPWSLWWKSSAPRSLAIVSQSQCATRGWRQQAACHASQSAVGHSGRIASAKSAPVAASWPPRAMKMLPFCA